MASIRNEIALTAPAERVWNAVRDFQAVHQRVAPGFLTGSKPTLSLINVIVRARAFSTAMEDAADVAGRVRKASEELRVLGPAPAPLNKLRGEYRAQVLQ